MTPSLPVSRKVLSAASLVLCAALLAGCETTSSGSGSASAATAAPAPSVPAPPPEPPMTRSRAAELCWMSTEKKSPGQDLDKRADIVTKCIEDRMAAAPRR